MPATQRDDCAADARRSEWRAFIAALLLFTGVVAFVGACGSEDLTFPGNVVQTETPQFTNTPGPTSTATTAR
jgi:hypothetical protein